MNINEWISIILGGISRMSMSRMESMARTMCAFSHAQHATSRQHTRIEPPTSYVITNAHSEPMHVNTSCGYSKILIFVIPR